MNLKAKKKEVKKIIRKENREMLEQQRIKSGFYQKVNMFILLSLLCFMSLSFYLLNGLYDNLFDIGLNTPKTYLNTTTSQLDTKLCPPQSFEARVTCYKATGNLTASGKVPKNGMIATSDRNIPFGTEMIIDGETYIVEDRTNIRLQTQFELPTIDIFMESGCDLNYGNSKKLIIIK